MYALQQTSAVIQCSTLGQRLLHIFDLEERHTSILILKEYIRSLRTLLVSEVSVLAHTEQKLTVERREHIDSLLNKLTDAEKILREEEQAFNSGH